MSKPITVLEVLPEEDLGGWKDIQVVIALGFHLFPFRTEKLSPITSMVLRNSGRVDSRRFQRKSLLLKCSKDFFFVGYHLLDLYLETVQMPHEEPLQGNGLFAEYRHRIFFRKNIVYTKKLIIFAQNKGIYKPRLHSIYFPLLVKGE